MPARQVRTEDPTPPPVAADRVYDAIYAAVIDHRLAPGSRLREEELAQTFAVSRTLVRQALHKLAQDGVIVLRPNRGAQVPEPTRRDGEHVFDARRVVECEVARRLAGKLSTEQLAELRQLVDAEARATKSQNKQEAIRLSGEFHLKLARMSGNPIFVRLLEELLPTTSLLMALYKSPGEPMCVAHSHQQLLQVIAKGAGAGASTEMRRHLNEIEKSLSQPAVKAGPALRDVFRAYRT
ncbi:GntR family transcriptional regulator [Rhizobacter sp. SG703]|uniref:GntR family transcriptional regulator n=1 Tax=Rhizobacter sp. SG703 TaxID=2587140 RepID=UPI001445C871|nr:GntR family transcriptional regulator [Rhizobacter sp. SG703]NKI94983.1 DNA-binding GntR family transcriptional regulator [Rhizobacter sp. SG703]